MSESKKTFREWWNGLHQQSKQAQHRVHGVLRDAGFQQVSGSSDGLTTEWQRHAGLREHLTSLKERRHVVALSREARAWLLCHLIAENGRLATELADIQTRKLRHPHLAVVNGIAGPAATLREIALSDDARLALEVLQALNEAGDT